MNRSLDTVDRLTAITLGKCSGTDDCAIQTMTLTTDSSSVWIGLRGSSALELWNVETGRCTMVTDLAAETVSTIRVGLTVSQSINQS